MPIDQGGDPWSGTTYKGFAGGPGAQPEPPPEPPRHGLSPRVLVIAGVAVALALGVGLGFLARPELAVDRPQPNAPAAAVAQLAPPSAAEAPIAITPPPAQAAVPPQPRGKLETLPPEMAAAERSPAQPAAAGEAAETASATAPEASADNAETPPAAAPPAEAAPTPAPDRQANFDCASARPGAEQIVCSDPELAADDRRLARAYRRALRAGIDPGDLRQEQRDWYAIREDAARHSRHALVQVYDQRIGELNQMADRAAPGAGGPDDDSGYGQ